MDLWVYITYYLMSFGNSTVFIIAASSMWVHWISVFALQILQLILSFSFPYILFWTREFHFILDSVKVHNLYFLLNEPLRPYNNYCCVPTSVVLPVTTAIVVLIILPSLSWLSFRSSFHRCSVVPCCRKCRGLPLWWLACEENTEDPTMWSGFRWTCAWPFEQAKPHTWN